MKATFFTLLYVFHLFYNPIDSGSTKLDQSTVDAAIKSHEFVFINFYADWCHFSNMLSPIWDEAADLAKEKFGDRVMLGKVDCDNSGNLGVKFQISKYPTLKYIINGEVAQKEYRGQRSKESIVEFVEKELRDPISQIENLNELANLDNKKRYVIGYFEDKNQPDYDSFKRVSQALKDRCQFIAGFGEAVKQMHPPGQNIVAFRPSYAISNDNDDLYKGDIKDHAALKEWATGVCIPLVREITFENAEELTEEGLPFMILFHLPEDTQSVKEYNEAIKNQVYQERKNVNFLTANGHKFAHPLSHLDKTTDDLPVIVIDSFRHMYLFKDFKDIYTPGKLKKFLDDLYSGKLHREFHYGPDKEEEQSSAKPDDGQGGQPSQEGQASPSGDDAGQPPASDDDGQSSQPPPKPPKPPVRTDPPPSQFQHLKPSKNRYTVLRDEF